MSVRALVLPLLVLAVFVAALALARPGPVAYGDAAPEFISQKSCKKCHFKQHKSWKKTLHAKALDLLKPGERAAAKEKSGLDPQKDYTKDPACLKCHVTGYGKPGGHPVVKETWSEDEAKAAKNNAGVGCEACHGAGSLYAPYKDANEEYKRADVAKLGLRVPVTAKNCTGCHNADSPTQPDDYEFDFEQAKNDAEAVHEHLPLRFEH